MNDVSNEDDFFINRLGALPDPPDSRDFIVSSPSFEQIEQTPKEYNGLFEFSPTNPWPNQGVVGSCVGWNGSIAMEITNTLLKLYVKNANRPDLLQYISIDLSAGWLYYWSRYYAGMKSDQPGSTNRGLMKALNHVGTALEIDVPTQTIGPWVGIRYSSETQKKALSYAIDSYWNVGYRLHDIKAALYGLTHKAPYKMPDGSDGKIPLVSAHRVYNTYRSGGNSGIVPLPKEGDKYKGGHSTCIIGWKIIDDKEHFITINSWGKNSGDNGLYYLPVDYPFYHNWWLIHNGPPTTPPEPLPTPSPCGRGRTVAKALNVVSEVLGRKGRFYYLNP